ncbi:MAG: linear amide C-N hydrolase [Chlamydiales bacterium]
MYIFLLCVLLPIKLLACTDFLLQATDQNVVVGRSMEFGLLLNSEIIIHPSGERQVSRLETGRDGKSWLSQYAYVGCTYFGFDKIIDGMNDQGLSVEGLWLPGTEYPKISLKDPSNIIAFEDVGDWLLGTCANLDEVKQALQQVQIWVHPIPTLNAIPVIHFAFHDRSGKSIVVEFLHGKMEISDNPVGVLTNAPKLEWHLTNLRNYINLTALGATPLTLDGSVLDPLGQGSGMLGIPGDWTPPSRFVRIAIFKDFVRQPTNAKENINLALHLLNTVDIPYGAIQSKNPQEYDFTQWVVIKDLLSGKLYYRTYLDQNISEVDFQSLLKQNPTLQKLPM